MMTLVPPHVDARDTFEVAAVSWLLLQTKGAPVVHLTQIVPRGARAKEESGRSEITIVDAGANQYGNSEVSLRSSREAMLS